MPCALWLTSMVSFQLAVVISMALVSIPLLWAVVTSLMRQLNGSKPPLPSGMVRYRPHLSCLLLLRKSNIQHEAFASLVVYSRGDPCGRPICIKLRTAELGISKLLEGTGRM